MQTRARVADAPGVQETRPEAIAVAKRKLPDVAG
jgi:hypothetical protein